jgi:NDP-sugar pyrophosphorylase family protein
MPRIRHALIMAAGRGLRMMPLTADIPKAMAPFNGTTLIRRGINRIRRHIEYIHITVGYKGAMLAEHVIDDGVSSVFNTSGHGNSWWVHNTVMKFLDEPIFVLTCDNVVELDFGMLETDYWNSGAPACMLVPVSPVDGVDGDYIVCDGNVVLQLDRQVKTDLLCSGIQIMNPSLTNRLTVADEDFVGLWRQLIPQKQVLASRIYPKQWFAADTLRQLDDAERRAAK